MNSGEEPSDADRARLISAWCDTTAALLEPASSLRHSIRDRGGDRAARLSPAGLQAGLECLVRGVRREVFEALAVAAAADEAGRDELVVLAGNLPALFLQPLARALASQRRVLLKPASQNPHFVEAFVADLAARLPELADSVRTRRWQGGDRSVEDPLFSSADRLVVYGDRAAVESVSRRRAAGHTTIVHGPKTSLAIAGGEADPEPWATKLGTDVALFDQRGCLSVGAVWVPHARLEEWVNGLVGGLSRQAALLPPGPPTPGEAAAVHAVRAEAVMRGSAVHPVSTEIAHGTVLCGGFVESWPVLRTLQIVPYGSLDEVHETLARQHGRIQGLALTSDIDPSADFAHACGASRVAPFGELQEADATWDDGETV